MARRPTSGLEDLVDIASELPWWIALTLTIISYFLIHHHTSSFRSGNHLINLKYAIYY